MLNVPAFHTLPQPCDFYFVRHGESESNADGRIQGRRNSPLSALGESHAEAAARWFEERGVDLVLSSPLSRAMQTATTIARHARAKGPDALPELIELDTGRYSGERIRELRSIDPELYRRFRVHSWEVVPDAERIESLQRRAATAWAYLIDRAKAGHRCIVAVSHGGMLQWLIKATIGSDEQRWMPLFETSNCGIFLFRAQSTLPGHRHRVEQSISDSNAMAADDTDDEPSTDDARRDSSAGDAYAGRRPAHPPAADPLESGGVAPQPRPPSAGGVRPASEPPTRHPAAAPGGGASALGGGDEELPEPPPGEPEEHVPGTGYYGVWAHMNLVPY